MKKKIAILGSTGSIGKNTINILKKDKKNIKIVLLTSNKNIKEILKQQKIFKVQNLIITDKSKFKIIKDISKKRNFKVYNNYECLKKIFKNKIDYVMAAITGISGLEPTLKIIKYSKIIAIANKESIVCAWNLVSKELRKNNTEFIPVDSEHFSIWEILKGFKINNVEKIYITASGGPLLNLPIKKINKISKKETLKHPNWSMGKKISIDSCTMMNKVFEVIEAQRIFNLPSNKIEILIHPKSYLHSIVKFKNGTVKLLIHESDMKIPIFNTLYGNTVKTIKTKKINFKKLNNLNLQKPNLNKFPCLRLQKQIPSKISLYETVLVSANDEIVKYYLDGLIEYNQIFPKLLKILNLKKFKSLKNKSPKNLHSINQLNEYVRLKTREVCIR